MIGRVFHRRLGLPQPARRAVFLNVPVARSWIHSVATRTALFLTQSTHSFLRIPLRQSAQTRFGARKFASASLPDHTKLTMPALSPTMTQGNILEWKVKEGDHIKAGSVLADVETDKATVPFESVEEGYIAKILVPAGSNDIPVNKLVAILVENPEDVAAFKDYQGGDAPAPPAKPKEAKQQPSPQAQQTPTEAPAATHSAPSAAAAPSAPVSSSAGERVAASPLAKMLASEKGVDLRQVSGTGPNNRIIAADVREFQGRPTAPAATPVTVMPTTPAAPPSPAGWYTDIPHTNIRKVIAQRLLQSKQTIPHYYLSVDCNIDEIMKIRAQLNAKLDEKEKLSVNDFIVKASALALRKVPAANSSWMDTAIRQYNYVDISVAVATPTGLITPIVKDADLKGLLQISSDVKRLAAKAKENKLTPEEFQGGTFTISNLGMFGVKTFSAIINPPQSCILAIGAAETRVVPNEGKNAAETPFKTAKVMSVTMSCDHRVVDGAVGAQWLQAFKNLLENPLNMLL